MFGLTHTHTHAVLTRRTKKIRAKRNHIITLVCKHYFRPHTLLFFFMYFHSLTLITIWFFNRRYSTLYYSVTVVVVVIIFTFSDMQQSFFYVIIKNLSDISHFRYKRHGVSVCGFTFFGTVAFCDLHFVCVCVCFLHFFDSLFSFIIISIKFKFKLH